MKNNKMLDLTTGSVGKKFLAFVLPILAANLLQTLYNAADTMVVGRFAADSQTALAAVGSTGPSITLILNLFYGLSVGANAVCSRFKGSRDGDGLNRCMHTAVLVAVIGGTGISILGVLFAPYMLVLMGLHGNTLAPASLYMRIIFMGTPGALFYNFGAGILRANGDSKKPLYILAGTGILNVVLNLFFVIVFHLDVAGVALATIIANYVSALVVGILLFRPRGQYRLQFKKLRIHRDMFRQLVSVGIPCGLGGAVFSISNVIIQSSLFTLGETAMAANTASGKIMEMMYVVLSASYTGCISFSGQCYGQHNYKRIDECLIKAGIFAVSVVSVLAAVCTLFPEPLLMLFTTDPVVAQTGTFKLIICAWGYTVYGIAEITIGCLRGMGKSTVPTIFCAVGICVPRLIWVWFIFPMFPRLETLYLCYPISWTIDLILQVSYYLHCRKKLKNPDPMARIS